MRPWFPKPTIGGWLGLAYASRVLFPLLWGALHAPESRWRIAEAIILLVMLLAALRVAFAWAAGTEERAVSIHDER